MPKRRIYARFARAGSPLVLCYHAVTDRWPDSLAVRPEAFEGQLQTVLRRGFRSVPASEVVSRRGRLVHVTFDDAYRNVHAALPVLERLGLHATIFACSDYASDGRPLLIPELRARAAGFEAELETMDWAALRDAASRGFEIGSHTCSHAHLPQLSDAELRHELQVSRDRIADETGRPCRYLAYPFGEFDARVGAAADAAGYTAAFALTPPAAAPRDAFGVPRVDVYRGDNALRFALKLSPVRTVVGRLRAVRAGG
jgi:peptidoglycan/xylan/chitin deacetylase (PgdA/CDA1 family)